MKVTTPITVADKPPTSPALPPTESDDRRKAAAERITQGPEREARARALELAVQTMASGLDVRMADGSTPSLFDLAEDFRAYITDGTVPAAETPPVPPTTPGGKK